MKKRTYITLIGFALLVSPATAQENDWGWHMWGWGDGPSWRMMDDRQQGAGMRMMQRMRNIDTNNDGVIGDDEAASQVESVFAAMDGDDDGSITADEYMSIRMGGGPGYNEARQAQMQARKKERFATMDPDKDGKVTQAEFIAAGKTRFAEADTDKDGKVTPWEFRAQRWQ